MARDTYYDLYSTQIEAASGELDKLLSTDQTNAVLRLQIVEIKTYYKRAVLDYERKDKDRCQLIIKQYSEFVKIAAQVKAGKLTAEEASKQINKHFGDSQSSVILHNILKVIEILFWMAVVGFAFSLLATVSAPLLFLEPVVGLLLIAANTFVLAVATKHGIDCFSEFKSFNRIDEEATRERDVLTFFSSIPQNNPPIEEHSYLNLGQQNS